MRAIRPVRAPSAYRRSSASRRSSRWRTGIAEFDFVLGRRHRARLADPGGRRARDRQIDAAAAGGGAARSGRACATLYVSGEESPEQLRMRADRLGDDAGPVARRWARPTSRAILHHARRVRTRRSLFLDSIQTTYTDDARGRAGERRPGARMRGAPDALREGSRPGRVAGRARHQGRRHRGSADARAHRGHGALLRGRSDARSPRAAGREEPLRVGGRDRRVPHDGRGPRAGAGSGGGLPGRAARRGLRLGGDRLDGRDTPGAGRGPGARRRSRASARRSASRRDSISGASRVLLAVLERRGGLAGGRARRLRERHGRRPPARAIDRPRGRWRRWCPACTTVPLRPTRCSWAKWAWAGKCGPYPVSSAG